MKIRQKMFSVNEFLKQNKFLSVLVHTILFIFFKFFRIFLRAAASNDGNVVIVSLHKLGDTIFTIPAVRAIRNYTREKIIIICFPESVPIYKLAFNDINFSIVDHNDFYFGQRIPKSKTKRKVKSLNARIIFDITGSMISAALIYNIRCKQIVGSNAHQFKAIYDHFTEFRESPQLKDIYLDAISSIVTVENRIELKTIEPSFNPIGKILIHPFAGWEEKEWPFKKYFELAERLIENYKVEFIIPTGSLSKDIISEIKSRHISVYETNSIEQLILCIKECALFIGNDSGPINIANFLGRPSLSIYGATNPDYTMTQNRQQIIIQKILNCSSKDNEKFCVFGSAVYNCPGIQCLNLLAVDEVYERVNFLLKKYILVDSSSAN